MMEMLPINPGCTGKIRFPDRAMADARIGKQARGRRVKRVPCGERLHAYRCRACGGWHIGS